MQKTPFNNNLLKQKVAISSYLDQLLHEATQSPAEPESTNKIISLVQQKKLIAAELLVAERKSPQSIPVVESEVEIQQDRAAVSVPTTLDPELFPLQCLMFRVADHLLSVPLIRMKSVVPWSNRLTCLPQSSDWMLGILKYHDQNVRVVDSTQVLHIEPTAESESRHILILGNEKWAITCDKLENVITLGYSDIQWNQGRKNAMFFGTIRSSLASLLNPDGIVEFLDKTNLKQTT